MSQWPDMESLSCTSSSLTFRFRPSPRPNHYDGRLATMPSADFCSITGGVTPIGVISVHFFRTQPPMAAAAPRLDRPVV